MSRRRRSPRRTKIIVKREYYIVFVVIPVRDAIVSSCVIMHSSVVRWYYIVVDGNNVEKTVIMNRSRQLCGKVAYRRERARTTTRLTRFNISILSKGFLLMIILLTRCVVLNNSCYYVIVLYNTFISLYCPLGPMCRPRAYPLSTALWSFETIGLVGTCSKL